MSHRYDLMQGAIGVALDIVVYDDKHVPVPLDDGTDSITYRMRFPNSNDPVLEKAGQIEDGPNGVLRLVTQLGDVNRSGRLVVYPMLTAPSIGYTGALTPVEYQVGPVF